ncbi:enkurin domain-containing protein 1-like [Gigantopelta aegis]|uniref:enkurin domain-containing protein 1-like n=1 Tax=Gigantopelta aegis TaxID=1735272 RepID=UPI001B88DFD5|nr:enkurin domain-containing protein 1-like [Gigantopelta aegis]
MQGLVLKYDNNKYGVPTSYKNDFQSKDHLRENVRRMRQIQRLSKKREQEAHQPVKGIWKSEKYATVESRIKAEIQKPSTPRPSSATFLRAHSRAGPPVKIESRPCTPDPSDKTSVPPASTANNVKLIRHDIDFIKVNGRGARHATIPRARSMTSLDDFKKKELESYKSHEFGEVPKYLKCRKNQWKKEEEERIANTPDPAMPPGHKVMPNSEREDTLALLKQKQKELIHQLGALPLRNDTFRIRTCKQELETKLAELEEAIKIFSRPKVFVKID